MELEEERFEVVATEEDLLKKDLKLSTNESIANQLIVLFKALRNHFELSKDERNNYIQLLKFYDNIVYMEIELLSLAILYISRYKFSPIITDEEKEEVNNFIVTRVIPTLLKQQDIKNVDPIKKNNITKNFISYLISLRMYLEELS